MTKSKYRETAQRFFVSTNCIPERHESPEVRIENFDNVRVLNNERQHKGIVSIRKISVLVHAGREIGLHGGIGKTQICKAAVTNLPWASPRKCLTMFAFKALFLQAFCNTLHRQNIPESPRHLIIYNHSNS